MKYAKNRDLKLGLELELQLINTNNQDLSPAAKNIIRELQSNNQYGQFIKPEITQSMIEIVSSPHYKPSHIHKELQSVCYFLKQLANRQKISICGGGTHPFQDWRQRKIFPTERFKRLAKQYGYLAKRFTVFSMHVHIGCDHPDKAIYLTHMLSRYVPHFIALSASSPFYNGTNTGFNSARSNIAAAFPLSGHIPLVKDWSQFCNYYSKLKHHEVIKSMKDLYWDIRPKPEFGTVEVRVCDMPLTLYKSVALVAYIQALSAYILNEQPFDLNYPLYDMYQYNRFQASKLGFDGNFINPFTDEKCIIQKDILQTMKLLRPYTKSLGTSSYLHYLKEFTKHKHNDATYLKHQYQDETSLSDIVKENCKAWKTSLSI